MAVFSKGSMKGFANIEPEGGAFELLPEGEYTMQAVKTDIKPTKKGDGCYVEVWLRVTDEGKYKGRQIIKRFNWENQNSDAERIGRQQLRGLALACGIPGEFSDSDALLNIPVRGMVFVEKGKGGYSDQNGVKNFKAAKAGTTGGGAVKPMPVSARATTATSFADEFAPRADNGSAPNWDF